MVRGWTAEYTAEEERERGGGGGAEAASRGEYSGYGGKERE